MVTNIDAQVHETIVLIKGEAKRVLIDDKGTILKVIKSEPHHMDGLFVDRPPIPDEVSGLGKRARKLNASTIKSLYFEEESEEIGSFDKQQIDQLIDIYKSNIHKGFVLKAKVRIEQDDQVSLMIERMQNIKKYIKKACIEKVEVQFDISERNELQEADELIVIALFQ